MSTLQHFGISHILRGESARADIFSRLVILADSILGHSYVKYLEASSINKAKEVQQVIHESSWMDPFIEYIIKGVLLVDHQEARLLKWRVSWFMLLDG